MEYIDLYELGNKYYYQRDYLKAIEFYDRCILKYNENFRLKDSFIITVLYNKGTSILCYAKNTKDVYEKNRFCNKGLFVFKTALLLGKILMDRELFGKIYFNLGYITCELKKYEESYRYFNIADDIFKGKDAETKKALELLEEKFKDMD